MRRDPATTRPSAPVRNRRNARRSPVRARPTSTPRRDVRDARRDPHTPVTRQKRPSNWPAALEHRCRSAQRTFRVGMPAAARQYLGFVESPTPRMDALRGRDRPWQMLAWTRRARIAARARTRRRPVAHRSAPHIRRTRQRARGRTTAFASVSHENGVHGSAPMTRPGSTRRTTRRGRWLTPSRTRLRAND